MNIAARLDRLETNFSDPAKEMNNLFAALQALNRGERYEQPVTAGMRMAFVEALRHLDHERNHNHE